MKRFVVFAGAIYYPGPGWMNCVGTRDTLEEALELGVNKLHDVYGDLGWWQVVDLSQDDVSSENIVAGTGKGHTGLFGLCPANPKSA